MQNISYGHGAVLALMTAAAFLGLGSCAQDAAVAEQLHIRYQHHDFVDDAIITSAAGCINIDVDEAGEILIDDPFVEEGGSSDLSVKRVLTNSSLRVTGVSETAGNQVLMEKLYSLDFIRSGFTDITDIRTRDRR